MPRPSTCALWVGLGLAAARPALGQPQPEPTQGSTLSQDFLRIVVQARRDRARELDESSEAVDLVDAQDAAVTGEDLGEILTRRSAVHIRRTGSLGSRTQASLAGLGDEQLRFLIDGVPIEFSPYAFGLGNVPSHLVERIEVFNGVVPIRFGADALGGAINLVTEPPEPRTGAALALQAGSFDTLRGSIGLEYALEELGVYVRGAGFVDRAQNDYVALVDTVDAATGRVQEDVPVHRNHDGYAAQGFDVSVGVRGRAWADHLVLRGYFGDYDKDVPHNVVMTVPYGAVTFARQTFGTGLRYEHQVTDAVSVTAKAGFNRRSSQLFDRSPCTFDWFGNCLSERSGPGEIGRTPIDRDVRFDSGYLRAAAEWALSPGYAARGSLAVTHDRRIGRDAYLAELDQLDRLVVPMSVTSLVGGLAFATDQLEDRLENVAFAKAYVQQASLGDGPGTTSTVEPARWLARAGLGDTLRFAITPRLRAQASYEWTARMPRPEEYFGDGTFVIENTELLPETSHNANIGLELDPIPTAVGELSGSVTGVLRIVDDLVVLILNDQFFRYENVSRARSLGVQVEGGWVSPGGWLALFVNASYTDIRNLSDEGDFARYEGQRLPNRPPLRGTVRAQARYPDFLLFQDQLAFEWTTRFVQEFFRSWEGLGAVDTKQSVPNQLVHSASVSYRLSEAERRLSLSLTVQNLTNERAFDVIGVQRPGRAFFATLAGEI